MKKMLATLMLLMCVSVAFAGKTGGDSTSGAIDGGGKNLCHDNKGKWNPQSKDCDPDSCGCLFHEIEEFIAGLFA